LAIDHHYYFSCQKKAAAKKDRAFPEMQVSESIQESITACPTLPLEFLL